MENKSQIESAAAFRPTIGLALSGGGARGLAHIGVLRAFERAGIPIDFLAGVSMGGIIAAGLAAGMTTREMEQEASTATRKGSMLRMFDPGMPHGGLLRGRRVYSFYKHLFGEMTFADLRLPLAVVAVDLKSHREVILDSGPVAMALRATTSLPGVFMPVEVDGMRLTDGGLLNNLPVDVVRKMGASLVIAVDIALSDDQYGLGRWVGRRRWMPGSIVNTLEVMDDTLYTLRIVEQEHKLGAYPPDVLITPALPNNINALAGYGRTQELIAAGERAGEMYTAAIKALI